MKNVEVEIQVEIKNPELAEKKLSEVGEFIKTRKQTDKYFVLPQRDFFNKETPDEYLRIRYEEGRNHVMYSNLDFDEEGWLKATNEYQTTIENPETMEEIFERIEMIPKITVKKLRKYFDCGDFEVVIDKVDQLGDFMEVEAKKDFGGIEKTKQACLDFLNNLGIEYENRKDMGYPRMLYKKLNNKN